MRPGRRRRRRRSRRRGLIFVIAAFAFLLAGCAAIFDFDDFIELSDNRAPPVVFGDPPEGSPLALQVKDVKVRARTQAKVNVRVLRPNGFLDAISISQELEGGDALGASIVVADSATVPTGKDDIEIDLHVGNTPPGTTYEKVTLRGTSANLSASVSFNVTIDPGPGDLDPTFGTGGVVSLRAIDGDPVDMAAHPDGRLMVLASSAAIALTQGGAIDPSFGDSGASAFGASPPDFYPASLALHDDGAIAVAGLRHAPDAGAHAIAVARLDAQGHLDGPLTGLTTTNAEGVAILTHSDRGVIVASVDRALDSSLILFALNRQGGLDTAFGDAGITRKTYGVDRGVAVDAMMRAGNGIFISGAAITKTIVSPWGGLTPGKTDFGLLHATERGALDLTLGFDGLKHVMLAGASISHARALAFTGNRIIMAGESVVSATNKKMIAVAAFDVSTRALDPNFGDKAQGFVRLAQDAESSWARDVVVDTKGRIVVVGGRIDPNDDGKTSISILRLDAAGNIDTSFGRRFPTEMAIPNATESEAISVVLDGDRPVVLARAVINGKKTAVLVRYLD